MYKRQSYCLKYADDSTDENPVVLAKGVDENGKEFEQRIYINDVNPSNATAVSYTHLDVYKRQTKRESVYNNLYRNIDKDDRFSAGWTMAQYEHQYRQAFYDAAKKADPNWEIGKPIKDGALDSVTRELAESGKSPASVSYTHLDVYKRQIQINRNDCVKHLQFCLWSK